MPEEMQNLFPVILGKKENLGGQEHLNFQRKMYCEQLSSQMASKSEIWFLDCIGKNRIVTLVLRKVSSFESDFMDKY